MDKQGGKQFRVLCQKWEESERGWGVRPDGYSLHASEEDLKQYTKEYWARMPDEAPDEYSRPSGAPYWCEVDRETHRRVMKSKHGIREFGGSYPGTGGTDGWRPLSDGGMGKK